MKNAVKRILSVLLVVAIALSLSTVAFAGGSKASTDKEYKVYTCLGDSNSAGYATEGYVYSLIPAPNAFHTAVAEGLGAELRTFAYGGFRIDEIRYMLDPTFEMDWDYAEYCMAKVKKADLDAFKADYIKAVEDADVISLMIGSNDIFGEDLHLSLEVRDTPVAAIQAIKEKLTGDDEFTQGFIKVLDFLDDLISNIKAGIDFVQRANKTIADYKVGWDAIIENIYRLNPDVTIVALSAVDGMSNTSYFEFGTNLPIKFGDFFTYFVSQMWDWVENGSKYKDTYIYCDTSDLITQQMYVEQPDFWDVYLANMHPSDEQHAEIARRILAVLEEN